MTRRRLGRTGFDVAPIVFGGNVFGWTLDEAASFSVLDAFIDHGFDAIDTADVYSAWKPGNQGGESETIIGRWLRQRPSTRDRIKLFTKVGSDLGEGRKGLGAAWIAKAVDDSLRRLQTEQIDLYFSHWPDPSVTHEETLRAYQRLIDAGKVRAIGASNYDAALLREALDTASAAGLPRYGVIQPEYSLMARGSFEGDLQALCTSEGVGVVTYFSLASGFLSGKYRSKADLQGRARGGAVEKYLEGRGPAVLEALDGVAKAHGASPAEVALAWLLAKPGVTAPIASATSVDQVASFAKAASLSLSAAEVAALDAAST